MFEKLNRYILRHLILLCCSIGVLHASPSVGITSLLYGENDAHVVFSKISTNLPTSIKVRPQILQSINTHITAYHNSLIRQLATESNNNFTVFDADSDLSTWRTTSGLLKSIANTDEILPSKIESQSESSTIIRQAGGSKYILIGFIESISEGEQHTAVDKNVVLIYNLDMVVKYRLVDMDTHKVVSVFTGIGHGGTARVVSSSNVIFYKSIDNVVNDMITSLVQNVDHALHVHQTDFVLEKRLPPPPKPIKSGTESKVLTNK